MCDFLAGYSFGCCKFLVWVNASIFSNPTQCASGPSGIFTRVVSGIISSFGPGEYIRHFVADIHRNWARYLQRNGPDGVCKRFRLGSGGPDMYHKLSICNFF